MNSIDYLDLLMSNQKKVKDGFKFINLKSNEQATIEDCYENIKKDLEILEVLKKYLSYDNNNHVIKMKQIRKSRFNFDYEDLKEWLENAK